MSTSVFPIEPTSFSPTGILSASNGYVVPSFNTNTFSMKSELHVLEYSSLYPEGKDRYISVLDLNVIYKLASINRTYEDVISQGNGAELTISLDLGTLMTWFKVLTHACLDMLSRYHEVVHSSVGTSGLSAEISAHQCKEKCKKLLYTFVPSPKRRSQYSILNKFGLAITNEPTVIRCSFIPYSNVEIIASPAPQCHDVADPLSVATHGNKLSIIKEWEFEMSTDELQFFVCAICAINAVRAEMKWIDIEYEDLILLRNDLIPVEIQPNDYDFHLYERAFLCVKGMEHTHKKGKLRVCTPCYNALGRKKMPKFALANWLYYGHNRLPSVVKEAFDKSSMFERMLIARARCNSICCRFSTTNRELNVEEQDLQTRNILSNSRRGIRGNVIVSPLDAIRMSKVIPPGSSSMKDTMCAVFIGNTLPTKSTIYGYSPVLVRRSRVKTMIQFLTDKNSHYKQDENFVVDFGNLDHLYEPDIDNGLPASVEIGLIKDNEAMECLTSDYTERNADSYSDSDELLMENVGYTDGDDTPGNYRAMKTAALERCLTGKPFIASGKGSTPVNDFNNPSILTWLFPHLDPWGIGGFHTPIRPIAISMEEQISHLLKTSDSPFQSDPEFAFVFFNVIRKAEVSRSMRFRVPYSTHRTIISDLLTVKPAVLESLNKECQKNPNYKPVDDDEKKAFKLFSSLGMVARHIPGSNGHKITMRNEIRALMNKFGAPTLFITINPSDVDNPIVRLYSGEDINLEDIYRGEDMSEWKRKILAARNPAACALFFELMISKFIKIILRYGRNEAGIYGKCKAYYGTVEAQGKGTLHCHMLIWLDGHLSPQSLRDEFSISEDYKGRYIRWLESVVRCEFPLQIDISEGGMPYERRIRAREMGNPHPGVIPAPSACLAERDTSTFWTQYYNFVDSLLYEYNWHDHQATCWKFLKRGQDKTDKNCRMGMDGTTRAETTIDDGTSALLLRRLHPYIVSYTDLPTFLMKCNVNVKFIGSGEAAKSFLYYVTDYITKYAMPLHVGMAALLYAIQKVSAKMTSDEVPSQSQSVSAVTTAVNSVMGKQEISHQQVMSYLIGGGDHYTSHRYFVVHWWSIYSFVESELRKADEILHSLEPDEAEIMVGITLGQKQIYASSQLLDYIYRPENASFNELCLYKFFSSTHKVRLDSSHEDGNGQNVCFISSEHPQQATHRLKMRTKEIVPVLLGPTIPNPKLSPDTEDKWAKFMVILFKPWRKVDDLKDSNKNWTDEFNQYEHQIGLDMRLIIKNMTVLSECKDARDLHRVQYTNEGTTQNSTVDHYFSALQGDLDNDDDNEMTFSDSRTADVFGALENFSVDPHNSLKELERHVEGAAGNNTTFHLDLCYSHSSSDRIADNINNCILGEASCMTEHEREDVSEQFSIMRQKRKRVLPTDELDETVTEERRKLRHQSPVAIRTVLQRESWRIPCSEKECNIIQSIVAEMNLECNPEQLRAFKIVANKVVMGGSDQLLMYVSGVGGTGKSHVIKSIVKLFERLGRRNELVLGAPTGIASVLIGGHTLHSLTMLSPKGGSSDVATLSEIWRPITCFLIDEVSMLDARFMSRISNRLRIAKGEDMTSVGRPFAGIDVIFMGDFGQLKPPVEYSLYSHKLTKEQTFSEAQNDGGISAMNGVCLWRQVHTVVELLKNHRQLSDVDYAEFLSRLRLGSCISKSTNNKANDFEYLQPRLLQNLRQNSEEMMRFGDAPVIVGSKSLRDVLNAKILVKHAIKIKKKVHIYYSKDVVHRVPAKSAMRRRLWDLDSSTNKDAFGRLPLFPGMKVMITENVVFESGIVNGREGIVQRIKYDEDNIGRRTATVVYVLVPGCGMHLPGLDLDVVPLFPTSTAILSRTKALRKLRIRSFTRKQIPLVPAYSYTDFKGQGRTLDVVVADIATARGQGVYVMLSRVRTLGGLAILRPFPETKIFNHLPEELRVELNRLKILNNLTAENLTNNIAHTV